MTYKEAEKSGMLECYNVDGISYEVYYDYDDEWIYYIDEIEVSVSSRIEGIFGDMMAQSRIKNSWMNGHQEEY